MISNAGYDLRPWVVKKENVLLGTKLNTFKVPHLNFSGISSAILADLIHNNFIISRIDQEKAINIKNAFFPKKRTETSGIFLNWIWITDSSFLEPAFSLKKYLSSLSDLSGDWEIVTDKNVILNGLSIDPLKKPFVIRLSHQEPIENEIIKNIYAGLMDETQIIWVGETTEGPHIGPIIQTCQDLEKYHVATKTWHFSQKLIEFGFKDFWPSSIYLSLMSDPQKIANAILEIINASPETCFLVEENRKTCLWTTLTEKKVSESTFFDTQFWSKGLIRNFKMDHFDSINEGYISKCRTPCKGVDYLEGNSGKGIDKNSALYSLVGESVERFSAWQSNREISKHNKPRVTNKKNYYDVSEFHPFGPKWSEYLASEKIALPLYEVKDEISPNRICLVSECLIPFPYEALEPQYDVTTSSTGGLAVHSDYKKAVINGALELFERDDLYSSFLFQKDGFVLDFSNISAQLSTATHDFILLLNCLKNNQLDYWCVVYSLKSTLPIVHFFIHDKQNHFFSRGTGSGYTLVEAIEKALIEGLQIRQQFLNNSAVQGCTIYDNWRKPEVIDQIQTYLEKLYRLSFFEHPLHSVEYTPSLLLEEIKENLKIKKKPLLVADLPCSIEGWFAVRVLIPGFATHQYPSESRGGKKIINPIFMYGVPT